MPLTRREWLTQPKPPAMVADRCANEDHQWLWLNAAGLFCASALWMSWSLVAVFLLQAGSHLSVEQLFRLMAIAGLSAGCLRVSFSLLVPAGAGGLSLVLVLALLLPLALGLGEVWRHAPRWQVLQTLALFSGLGGACFSAFVATLGDRNPLPGRRQSLELGLGIGLGHLGIAASLVLVPLLVAWPGDFLGAWERQLASSHLLRLLPPGESFWPQRLGYFWAIALAVPLLLSIGLYRRDLLRWRALLRFLLALLLGLGSAVLGVWLLLPVAEGGPGLGLSRELILLLSLAVCLLLLRLLPGLGREMESALRLLRNRHAWIMSLMGIMSLGSLLGFAATLPLTLTLVFGYVGGDAGERLAYSQSPGVFTYVWLAPLAAVVVRPLGSWLARRYGAIRLCSVAALVMAAASALLAYYLGLAWRSPLPEQYFLRVLVLFIGFFAAAACAYVAILEALPRLFSRRHWLHICLWVTAISAFGVFYISHMLGDCLTRGVPEEALLAFAIFYLLCGLLLAMVYRRQSLPSGKG